MMCICVLYMRYGWCVCDVYVFDVYVICVCVVCLWYICMMCVQWMHIWCGYKLYVCSLFVYVHTCRHTCATACVWRSEDNLPCQSLSPTLFGSESLGTHCCTQPASCHELLPTLLSLPLLPCPMTQNPKITDVSCRPHILSTFWVPQFKLWGLNSKHSLTGPSSQPYWNEG